VILLVDDDVDVRESAAALLRSRGYQVREAPDAEAALVLLRRGEPFRLLVTDIAMPGTDGWTLAHEAKRLRPELRIIYISGFPKEAPSGGYGIGYGPLIPKPWKTAQLLGHVQDAMR
jgi:CheY-like chemotaxis protein